MSSLKSLVANLTVHSPLLTGLRSLLTGLLLLAGTAWGGAIVSQGSGAWDMAGTWNGGVPGASDDVHIRSGDTVTISGVAVKTVNSLFITGTLTHANNTGSTEDHKVNLRIANNLTIAAGGAIHVDGMGFGGNAGAGAGGSAGGGGYGGHGGDLYAGEPGGPTYGSITAPTNIGCGSPSVGGKGGGAVILSITGAFTQNGTISANGAANGGSGGSIYVTCGSISGSGTQRCTGATSSHGGGGGGRIAVVVTSGDFSAFTGSMTAYGGVGAGSINGAAGTVYKQTSAQGAGKGDLVIDGGNIATRNGEATDIPAGATWTVGNLILKNQGFCVVGRGATLAPGGVSSTDSTPSSGLVMNGGALSFAGTFTVSNKLQFIVNTPTVLNGNLVLTNGATLTHSANWNTETCKLNLGIKGNFTLASDATVNVDGKGYGGGSGPGPGINAGGGAHGGQGGGEEGGHNAAGVVTYGSITAPTNCGSGTGAGGKGGGAVILSISGAATLDGPVSANGVSGAGGGAGGSIYLACGSLSGAGILQCNGGTDTGQAGGGGGRIAVVVTDSRADFSGFAGSMTAYGGDGLPGRRGAAGTVYRKAANRPHGDLIVNHNLSGTTATTLISAQTTDAAVGDVQLANGAAMAVSAAQTLTVYGNWSNSATPTIGGGGFVEFKGAATSTIYGSTAFNNLTCATPGKTLQFEGGSTQTVSGRLTLAGAEGNPLTLKSATPGTRWKLNAERGSIRDVRFVQVADSEAIANDPIVAFDSDGPARNNYNWAFGAGTNVWTGSQSASWDDRQNWRLGRLPTHADTVVIAVADNAPVLDSDREIGVLIVDMDAVLEMNNRTLCVRGDVRNAGKISGKGTLRLTGATARSVTAGGNGFDILEVASTGTVIFADGFKAARFACRVPGAELVFGSGSAVTIGVLDLLGAPGRPVTIRSSSPPAVAKWKLTGHAVVYYADVADQDASAGNRICPVDSTGNGHTPNWDFSPKHCRGGVETEMFIGDLKYRIHTFTNSGILTVNRNLEVEYLIVAGGGGGGNLFQGGGGGGGGFLEGKANVTNGALAVGVGVGGKVEANGGDSSIQGVGVALGGGHGGSERVSPEKGGSGGGGCHGPDISGAAGTAGQGYAGGNGANVSGGGGGGAGGAGKAVDDPTSPYAGGPGRVSSITGEEVTYAAGGGGRHRQSGSAPARDGAANTGNGGEGCSWESAAGAGGSGIVVVRYKLDIHNRPVSRVTPGGATFNAYLARANPAPAKVSVLWGEVNGVASGSWEHTNSWKAGHWGANSNPGTNMSLTANRSYYYTFEVTCATNREEADVPVSFITGAVDVKATKRESTEEKPASFVISRPATATNGPLAVHFTLGGTGVNGTDYDPLASPAVIPAGATEIRLPVVPNFNMGETRPKGVELTIVPGGYLIGVNSKASMATRPTREGP